MADAAVNFLAENLMQLVSENEVLIRGVDDEFRNLLEQVQRLKAFLDDAGKYNSDSSQWKELEKEIQRTVHRAEDVIDRFLVKAKLNQQKGKVAGIVDVGFLAEVRNVAAEIKSIHERVKEIRHNNQQAFQPRPAQLELPRKGTPEEQQDEAVGFDEEAAKVIKRIVEGTKDLEFVPVVGMPGLGKTTLARKIWKDNQIGYEFIVRIWVYVGQSYKIKDVYFTILKGFQKRIEEYQHMDVDELAKVVCALSAQGSRCLIVLDDVWDAEVTNAVWKILSKNGKGHRIMMTTRDNRLARYANPDPHNLKFLTKEESFHLLVKRVFGKGSCPNELVGLGGSIAGSCAGVPLAVVVIAGALRGRPYRSDWQRVERNVGQHLYRENFESSLKFIDMSYDCLPQEVQSCFLYCGVFPRGFYIPSTKLIRLWIAEGLIKQQQTYTLEQIAEFYLNDLVNRSLVTVMQKKSDGRIKTCRLHDLLHEFCRKEASARWLFQEVCPTPDQTIPSIQDSDASRRLCIQSSVLHGFLSTTPFTEQVRSFLCFSSNKEHEIQSNDIKVIQKAFPLIRVLDIESLQSSFTKNFGELLHLRYTAISGKFISLPPLFGNFWNLQTVILNTSEPTLDIKADIWILLQLRHLHTNKPAKLPSPSTTTGRTSRLQTLSKAAPESCKKDVLAKACHLRKLSIQGKMEAFLETCRGGISNLEELKCLEYLKLFNDVLDTSRALHLPPAFFRYVRTLRKLTLENTRFAWSEADKLGQLECLEVLKLKENAFTGEYWKPDIGGFSALQVLWIERAKLESWEASNHNFPILRHLVLISCDKLTVVPLGLADIPNFQEMRLENTSKAVKSAKEILECKNQKNVHFTLTVFPPEAGSTATL